MCIDENASLQSGQRGTACLNRSSPLQCHYPCRERQMLSCAMIAAPRSPQSFSNSANPGSFLSSIMQRTQNLTSAIRQTLSPLTVPSKTILVAARKPSGFGWGIRPPPEYMSMSSSGFSQSVFSICSAIWIWTPWTWYFSAATQSCARNSSFVEKASNCDGSSQGRS